MEIYCNGLYSVRAEDDVYRVYSGETPIERYFSERLACWRADNLASKDGFGEPRKS